MESQKHSKSDASKRAMDSRVSVTDVRSDLSFAPHKAAQRLGNAVLSAYHTKFLWSSNATTIPECIWP